MSIKSRAKSQKKRKARKNRNRMAPKSAGVLTQDQAARGIKNLFDPRKLTAPTEINDDLRSFCGSISDLEPFFLDVEPEPWSRQSCCDLNVKEYIKIHGGKVICGYKIWYHRPIYIEAERHAVWEKDGTYKDISFNADGENRILFLPDVSEKQNALESNRHRFRWGKDAETRQLIDIQEYSERFVRVHKLSDEEAWNTMLTYEDWKKGQRMRSLIPISI
jgi:hypothetical protein